jgi:pimeloyl-ACP methyl ester carboxylesterase
MSAAHDGPVVVLSGSVRLHVESTGDGDPIVFVHEFGSDLREWEEQVRWFSRTHRCITYNARGYPPSDVPESADEYGWELSVADLVAVLDGLDIDRAHVVGLSMGGYAVLQFALLHPTRARSVVAAGAGTGSSPAMRDTWPAYATEAAKGFLDRGMAAMATELGNSPTRLQLKRKNPRAYRDFMEHLAEHSALGMANTMARYQTLRPSLYDFRDAFAAMTVPVLLAVGDEDAPCLETNLMLKQTIPTAGLWICPDTGHAINLEEPAAFNTMVGAFLDRIERLERHEHYEHTAAAGTAHA